MIYLALLSLVAAAVLRWLARAIRKDLRFQGGTSASRLGLFSTG